MAIPMGARSSSSLQLLDSLPLTVDEITPQWLGTALGINIKNTEVIGVISGTSTKILLQISYAGANDGDPTRDLPRSVCVKGGFSAELRDLEMDFAYRREAEFFAYVAPNLDILLPRSWYTAMSTKGQGLVILENLSHCDFGKCTEPWAADKIAKGLDQLAGLHASTWGATAEQYPFLSEVSPLEMVADEMLMTPGYWDFFFTTDNVPPNFPKHLLERERIRAGLRRMKQNARADLQCVVHGDPHVGNTFITSRKDIGFLDFQCVFRASAMHDVAYFITGGMTIAERREHEHQLVAHYLKALWAAGGPQFTVDQIWNEYRKHHLHGFMWAITPPVMQPKEAVWAMAARHLTAIVDHDSLALIEGA